MCCTLSLLLPHRGSNSHPNPYVGHAAIQLVVALPALAQTALKPKQVAVVRVKENRCHLLTGEKEQIYMFLYIYVILYVEVSRFLKGQSLKELWPSLLVTLMCCWHSCLDLFLRCGRYMYINHPRVAWSGT